MNAPYLRSNLQSLVSFQSYDALELQHRLIVNFTIFSISFLIRNEESILSHCYLFVNLVYIHFMLQETLPNEIIHSYNSSHISMTSLSNNFIKTIAWIVVQLDALDTWPINCQSQRIAHWLCLQLQYQPNPFGLFLKLRVSHTLLSHVIVYTFNDLLLNAHAKIIGLI